MEILLIALDDFHLEPASQVVFKGAKAVWNKGWSWVLWGTRIHTIALKSLVCRMICIALTPNILNLGLAFFFVGYFIARFHLWAEAPLIKLHHSDPLCRKTDAPSRANLTHQNIKNIFIKYSTLKMLGCNFWGNVLVNTGRAYSQYCSPHAPQKIFLWAVSKFHKRFEGVSFQLSGKISYCLPHYPSLPQDYYYYS